jgi:hypothetical protein
MSRIRKFGFLGALIVFLFIGSVFLFFNASLRAPLRDYFAPAERTLLSVANGRVFEEKASARVVKVSTPSGIVIEVYGPAVNNTQPLVDKIQLKDRRDAYIQFQGRATNLALKDMDGDSVFEIIAPTYDSSLVPRLNIFRYNKDSRRFETFLE